MKEIKMTNDVPWIIHYEKKGVSCEFALCPAYIKMDPSFQKIWYKDFDLTMQSVLLNIYDETSNEAPAIHMDHTTYDKFQLYVFGSGSKAMNYLIEEFPTNDIKKIHTTVTYKEPKRSIIDKIFGLKTHKVTIISEIVVDDEVSPGSVRVVYQYPYLKKV